MVIHTVQKMMFSIKDFFSKCDQVRGFLWILSHLLKNSLMENFISCAVTITLSKMNFNFYMKSLKCQKKKLAPFYFHYLNPKI